MNILIEKGINDANALLYVNGLMIRVGIFKNNGWGTRYLIRLIVTK